MRLALVCTLSMCLMVVVSALPTDNDAEHNSAENNYNCPTDCSCTLAHNTHTPFLHAKCSSLQSFRSGEKVKATLPIHSIDLSYLNLPRLSHSLEKLRDLTSIDLSHNELHEIGHFGRRIKKLNLKHNRITSSKLSKLPQHLQVLNLQHNDITYLPLEFTRLTHLQSLELSHNTINCTCETLEVRNWLQERHVFMEHAVQCSYPSEVKGKPWLQVKQSDICAKEKQGWYAAELEENDLMMGDQAADLESSGELEEEEELGKAFLPIEQAGEKSKSTAIPRAVLYDDVEGSGDLSETPNEDVSTDKPMTQMLTTHEQEQTTENSATTLSEQAEDEEASGSGGGMLYIPHLVFDDDSKDDAESSSERPSASIFGTGIGIFDGSADVANEELIVPIVHKDVDAGTVVTDGPEGAVKESEEIKTAKIADKNDDSNATYFLLGVIALIVVGLILYVGIKRCKHNRRAAADAENQRELQDMDKKNPGKPLQRNGYEHAPLIGEKSKIDQAKPINGSKPYNASDVKDGPTQQQPLINGGKAAQEPVESVPKVVEAPQTQAPHEYYPITPRYPTPQSPRASKYAQYPPSRTTSPTGEPNNNDNSYLPSSPKSGRYSPVYSPETGRVKIKLTETPRPKTPMLVTRSKSNAGEVITTPVHAVNNNANGQVVH